MLSAAGCSIPARAASCQVHLVRPLGRARGSKRVSGSLEALPGCWAAAGQHNLGLRLQELTRQIFQPASKIPGKGRRCGQGRNDLVLWASPTGRVSSTECRHHTGSRRPATSLCLQQVPPAPALHGRAVGKGTVLRAAELAFWVGKIRPKGSGSQRRQEKWSRGMSSVPA